jgi:NOL1/NOP2/fmu family ribosome biogenesis protein
MACLRKAGGAAFVSSREKGGTERRKGAPNRLPKKDEERLRDWVRVDRGPGLAYFYHSEFVYAIPEGLLAEISVLQSACYLKRAGVPLGRWSVKEFIPEHDLALSKLVHPELPFLSLSREQALSYLRKDELAVETDHRGWMLVQYAGLNLGWIKALPGRINNYYPKEWRILRREP